jgi:DNA-directed RNA polymerase specialized sigma24 family protein
MDDTSILLRSRSRPEEFAVLFDRHAPHIHRYLARRLGTGMPMTWSLRRS